MTIKDLIIQIQNKIKLVNDNPNNDIRPWIVIAEKNGVRKAFCREILRFGRKDDEKFWDFEVTNEHPTEAEIEEVISANKTADETSKLNKLNN